MLQTLHKPAEPLQRAGTATRGAARGLAGTHGARAPSYSLPPFNMTTVVMVVALLASPLAPTDLVAFEFSARVRSALESCGRLAMSCDVRSSDVADGWHYQGHVQDVAHLAKWERFYAFPPCYHQTLSGAAYARTASRWTAADGGAWRWSFGAGAYQHAWQ